MSVETILPTNVAETYSIKLSGFSTTGGIDWEKGWPSKAAANEANGDDNLEEAQEEIAIE